MITHTIWSWLRRSCLVPADAVSRGQPPFWLILLPEFLQRHSIEWALTSRPNVPNGVLSSEFYASEWDEDSAQRIAHYAQRGAAWAMPFFIDEFAAFNYTGVAPYLPTWRRDTGILMDFTKRHHVGWALRGYGNGLLQTRDDLRKPRPYILAVLRRGF